MSRYSEPEERAVDDLHLQGLPFRAPSGSRPHHEDPIVLRPIDSPLGTILLGATSRGVCSLSFGERSPSRADSAMLERALLRPVTHGTNEHLDLCAQELALYFEGSLQAFSVPIQLAGTPFQEAVWTALRSIRYGETLSYSGLALRIGRPGSQRAVGHANGQNRIAILVPCHRVIERSGEGGGYAGSRWRKNFLLNLEKRAPISEVSSAKHAPARA